MRTPLPPLARMSDAAERSHRSMFAFRLRPPLARLFLRAYASHAFADLRADARRCRLLPLMPPPAALPGLADAIAPYAARFHAAMP